MAPPKRPCARCGALIWFGPTSATVSTCLPCRRASSADPVRIAKRRARKAELKRRRYAAKTPQVCVQCAHPRPPGRRLCDSCRVSNLRAKSREMNYRRRQHRRPLECGDITRDYERGLRRKAKRCPMPDCGVAMTDKPFLPHSKELDHIVPLHVGGTHTVGNVRIICRRCNTARPIDGSDYCGQVSLWSQDAEVAATLRVRPKPLFCDHGTRRSQCDTCTPPRRAMVDRSEDGRRAAMMRANGEKWADIARKLGIKNTGAAYCIAITHGDPDVIARWPHTKGFKRARTAA